MPRESEYYRPILARLLERFGPNKGNLSCKDVATYCGISYNTAKSRYEIGCEGIAIEVLATKMAHLHEKKRKAVAKNVPVS